MICDICGREARGFGYSSKLARTNGKPGVACSMKHLNKIKEVDGMIDVTNNEVEAALHGGRMGGEYLDELGKTNLAALTKEEWTQFLLCVVGGFTKTIANSRGSSFLAEDEIPF